MTEVQKALYGHNEPRDEFRIGFTSEEWQRERAKNDPRRNESTVRASAATIQNLLTLAMALEDGPKKIKVLLKATGLTPTYFENLLATAENFGLLLWWEPGVIGCLNSRRWRDDYLKTVGRTA